MKKKLLLIFPVIILFSFSSCDDQVNPKGDFKQIYALNCIIKADSSYQIATITRSYDVNGFDPMTNTSDPFIGGASVKVFYKDSVFIFRDTSIARTNDPRYTTPLHFYYCRKLKPASSNPIRIEAVLPNGITLKADTKIFSFSDYLFVLGVNTILPFGRAGDITYNWIDLYANIASATQLNTLYYAPELVILYSKLVNGVPVKMQKKVPMWYQIMEIGDLPVYPPIQTQSASVTFTRTAFDKAMAEISQDDPNKQNYIIDKAVFRLLVLDYNLAAYYSAQRVFLDEFSVRFDQADFTNISGGYGIFGTYTSHDMQTDIFDDYVAQFGYKKK